MRYPKEEVHMNEVRSEILRLSKEAESLADFLKQACKLLDISYRKASLEAGLYHGAVWSIVSGRVERGEEDTIAKLALFFKVPEVNLLRLVGYTPQYISPTHRLEEAEAIFQVLTDEEKEEWIRLGELLLRARQPHSRSPSRES
jgi:transcriptional regulator with XRE-family HTH domain